MAKIQIVADRYPWSFKTLQPLKKCEPNSGYVKINGVWRYNCSSLHARINRRGGLSATGR